MGVRPAGRDAALDAVVARMSMEERYEQGSLTIAAKASYSKFRQFSVTTSVTDAREKK